MTIQQQLDELAVLAKQLADLAVKIATDSATEGSKKPDQSRFAVCVARILKHEGGFVNHPKDPGGATNMGITIATARAVYGPDFSIGELMALTSAEAAGIYRARYWETKRLDCEKFKPGMDYVLFDAAVNSGKTQSVRWLQQVLDVKADGVAGPITQQAARESEQKWLINRVLDLRKSDLQRWQNGALWEVFGKGWSKRIKRVRVAAHADWEGRS